MLVKWIRIRGAYVLDIIFILIILFGFFFFLWGKKWCLEGRK